MKKLLALLLATLMVFSLVGCGKETSDGDNKKDYSKLSTADKITYILGEISDEEDTNGHYINELIGIRIALDSDDSFRYDLEYPTKSMKETDYTKEYLSTIEAQEKITVFSAKETYDSMTIELKKMPQAEIDKLDIETYLKGIKGEDVTIHRGKVANIPVYYTSEQYSDYMFGCFFVIKCDGYLAEFSAKMHDSGKYLFEKVYPIETKIEDVGVKDSKLQQLYSTYQEIEQIGEITGKEYSFFSESDDKGNEIKRVYGTAENLTKETMVMYKPDNNTISILSVDAGFYDGYSFEDGIIVEFNEDNKPIKSVEVKYVDGDKDTITKTYSYDTTGRIIEIHREFESNGYTGGIMLFRSFEYIENSNNIYISGGLYEFDDNGFLISNEDGDYKFYYEYDKNGNAIKQYTKNSSGEIDRTVRNYEYNEYGCLVFDGLGSRR